MIGITVIVTIEIPRIIYWKLDENILDNIQIAETVSNWNSFHGNQTNMSINEKIEILGSKDDSIETVNLETGNQYSLYEARNRCFSEMCKIPIIQMDIYGPVTEKIHIEPILYINAQSPSKSMIVWEGTVLVNGVDYSVTLEEESGKILCIQAKRLENDLQEQLQQEWKKYLTEISSKTEVA